MKITTQMTEAAYSQAKDVHFGKVSSAQALDYLEQAYEMNRNSANDYIEGFKRMIAGERYTRTFNTEATDYFLSMIYADFGKSALENALDAVSGHVEYYEDLTKGTLKAIRKLISKHELVLKNAPENNYPDELTNPNNYSEGQKKQIYVNSYERSIEARNACINQFGASCMVCELNFENTFGEIGKGFIHVHHIIPLSNLNESYKVDPIKDLIPVCPNCHAMLHKRIPRILWRN